MNRIYAPHRAKLVKHLADKVHPEGELMFVIPEVDEIRGAAQCLGIHLSTQDAVIYQKHLAETLRVLDGFLATRMEESRPPAVYTAREPGYRPSSDEDPLNAWLWRCSIRGATEGILAGKTVSYKDHVAVAGIPLTFGSFALEDFIPDFDATIVTRTLEAGGTVIGKNTMNGFTGGFGFGGSIGDYGRPKNPQAPDHLTGGSSSGSAAAVAAGDVDISFGGDQGGSIRIPAAWSGAVGLKPTFGLISHFGIGFACDQSVDHTGPIARTVEEVAAALQAVAGYDGLDPRQDREIPQAIDALGTLDDGLAGIRIGVLDEGFAEAEPDVTDLVNSAVDVLSHAGAKVSRVSVPEHFQVRVPASALDMEGSLAVFQTGLCGMFTKTYYPSSLIAAINRMWEYEADQLYPPTKLNYLIGEFSRRTYHGRVYAKAQNVRAGFVRSYDAALSNVDVLAMPTCVLKAPKFEAPGSYQEAVEESLQMSITGAAVRNTQPFNYTGHPALAIPCGKSGGLPVSIQLVGRFLDDPLLLRVGYAYEHSAHHDDAS